MSVEVSQQLQPVMQVKVTPKQIAANYILQMSSVELQEAISQELDENPALEMQELPTCPICGSPVVGNYCTECMPRKADDADDGSRLLSADDLPGDGAGRLREEGDEFDPIARAEADFTLEDHLTWNLHALLPSRLHHVADHDRPAAVAEMYRVLHPGGTLLIGEFRAPSRGRRWPRLHHFRAGNTIEQARELTARAGFTNIDYADTNLSWLGTITAVKPVSTTVDP